MTPPCQVPDDGVRTAAAHEVAAAVLQSVATSGEGVDSAERVSCCGAAGVQAPAAQAQQVGLSPARDDELVLAASEPMACVG